MDRFVISTGEGEYIKDVDETMQIIITKDFQESALFEEQSEIGQKMYSIVKDKVLCRCDYWHKIYIDLSAR
jgi:methyl coenzyme M reductase alpha subunit